MRTAQGQNGRHDQRQLDRYPTSAWPPSARRSRPKSPDPRWSARMRKRWRRTLRVVAAPVAGGQPVAISDLPARCTSRCATPPSAWPRSACGQGEFAVVWAGNRSEATICRLRGDARRGRSRCSSTPRSRPIRARTSLRHCGGRPWRSWSGSTWTSSNRSRSQLPEAPPDRRHRPRGRPRDQATGPAPPTGQADGRERDQLVAPARPGPRRDGGRARSVRRDLAAGEPRRPGHADLHLGHHRHPQGRHAHAEERPLHPGRLAPAAAA